MEEQTAKAALDGDILPAGDGLAEVMQFPTSFGKRPTKLIWHSVAICIPTRRRPLALRRCLESLEQLVIPKNVYVRIVVAHNGDATDQANARMAVEDFRRSCHFLVTLLHDEVEGIARARNAAMLEAWGRGADYIAFIDDDEIADRHWLVELMREDLLDVEVVSGVNVQTFPSRRPFWAQTRPDKADRNPDRLRRTASSGNVRFSAKLIEAGLRFDEYYAHTGGEDIDFFSRAAAAGFKIRRTFRAITREPLPRARLTYSAQVYREYWVAAVNQRMRKVELGAGRAAAQRLPNALAHAIGGAGLIALALPALLTGPARFKHCALKGGKKIAKAVGYAAATIGHAPQPYAAR